MAKTTLYQAICKALQADGFFVDKQLASCTSFAHMDYGKLRYYVGVNGSFRKGHTRADCFPVSNQYKDMMIDRGMELIHKEKENKKPKKIDMMEL